MITVLILPQTTNQRLGLTQSEHRALNRHLHLTAMVGRDRTVINIILQNKKINHREAKGKDLVFYWNCRKLSLKQYKCIIFQFWRSEVSQGVLRATFLLGLLGTLGEKPFPCLFKLLEAACSPWPLSSVFKASNNQSSLSHMKSLSFLPSSFTYKDPHDYTGLTQIIHDDLSISKYLNLITSTKSQLPCKVTYSRSCDLGYGHLLRGHYSAL